MFLQYPQKLWHFLFCGGEGIERVWEYPNKQNAEHFLEKGTLFLCLLRYFIFGRDGKGMERKRIIKNGHIVVKNPLAYELPRREVVIKSGRTLYRFTGSYDGERSLPHKVLRLMEQENPKKDVD